VVLATCPHIPLLQRWRQSQHHPHGWVRQWQLQERMKMMVVLIQMSHFRPTHEQIVLLHRDPR
jgi:hypothetical protein